MKPEDAIEAGVGLSNDEMVKEVGDFQRKILEIQTGKRKPPSWFKRTGFDTAEISLDGLGTIGLVSASCGTIDKLDRATDPAAEAELEMDAVIECIEKIPDGIKLRRPLKINNKTLGVGHHWENLWDLQAENKNHARSALHALFGGKAYGMLKLAMVWLSKIDVPTMIGADPEPGSSDEQQPRPTA